ncbi:MAG: S-adenosylmethionine:tRNA ribosyltransferase-isomerase, partial [Gemmatimonadetes bacterium]|nr:S-adenosylmethionine:tRNA ribosyltransferase-isomerase [Gemmatimonadota bacterium]
MTPPFPALATADFDYSLPPELIAQVPTESRGASRLLVLDRDNRSLADRRFGDLVELVPPGDLLVLNSTRVLHARLLGRRPTGAAAEVLLIHPAPDGTWIA